TIQFVVSPEPKLPAPTLKLSGKTATYDGQVQGISAMAVGKDGVTPVNGTFEFAYNGSATNAPFSAGAYPVLVTFTSGDPNYRRTSVLTQFTIKKTTPAFSSLSSPAIAVGTATAIVSGSIAAHGSSFPSGDYVILTLDGVSEATTVGTNGNFSTTFDTTSL